MNADRRIACHLDTYCFAATWIPSEATCRLHGVDPYTYLVDVLQRISLLPAREVEQLTPRCWKTHFAANPLRSDLDHAD